MASDRNAAKQAVKNKQQIDNDFSSLLDDGRKEATILQNRLHKYAHDHNMAKLELGHIGNILGSSGEKPGNIAFIVIMLCFIAIFILMFRIDVSQNTDYFIKVATIFFSIITGSLGYLFGAGQKNQRQEPN